MRKLKNVEEIEKVEFDLPVYYTCPLGGLPTSCIVRVEFYPDEYMFDFDEVEEWIDSIRGEVSTLEGVSKRVRDFLFKEYSPAEIQTFTLQENYYQNYPCKVTTKSIRK